MHAMFKSLEIWGPRPKETGPGKTADSRNWAGYMIKIYDEKGNPWIVNLSMIIGIEYLEERNGERFYGVHLLNDIQVVVNHKMFVMLSEKFPMGSLWL